MNNNTLNTTHMEKHNLFLISCLIATIAIWILTPLVYAKPKGGTTGSAEANCDTHYGDCINMCNGTAAGSPPSPAALAKCQTGCGVKYNQCLARAGIRPTGASPTATPVLKNPGASPTASPKTGSRTGTSNHRAKKNG